MEHGVLCAPHAHKDPHQRIEGEYPKSAGYKPRSITVAPRGPARLGEETRRPAEHPGRVWACRARERGGCDRRGALCVPPARPLRQKHWTR